jgi:hypothetical protein
MPPESSFMKLAASSGKRPNTDHHDQPETLPKGDCLRSTTSDRHCHEPLLLINQIVDGSIEYFRDDA